MYFKLLSYTFICMSLTHYAEAKPAAFYAGVQGGYTHQAINLDLAAIDVGPPEEAEISNKNTTSSNQFNGGIYGGYYMPCLTNRIYFEAFGNVNNTKSKKTVSTETVYTDGNVKFSKDYTLGVALNYEFTPDNVLSPYFRIGGVNTRFKLTQDGDPNFGKTKEHTNLWGISAGAGLRIALNKDFSLRLSYVFNNYEEYKSDAYTSDTEDKIKFSVRTTDHNFNAGIHYAF